jgi:hypothetical protein
MRTDRRTDGRDESNSRLSRLCEHAKKASEIDLLNISGIYVMRLVVSHQRFGEPCCRCVEGCLWPNHPEDGGSSVLRNIGN